MGFLTTAVNAWQNAPGGSTGYWFGAKDRGLTEKAASYLSGGKTTDLSNAIFGTSAQTVNTPKLEFGNGPIIKDFVNQTKTTPTVLGASTIGSTGGQDTGSNPYQAQIDAAEQARQAELSAANTELDRNQATLQQQLLQAEQEKGNAITGAENNWNQLLSGVNEKRTESGKLTDEAIGQAGSTARNTQRSNRNVLRSLGILNSTYASDKLQEPTNQFDVERGRLVQGNLDNIKKLDDFELNKKNEHLLAKDQIVQQYGNIVASINNDLRFNDRQRLDAVKQAQAAASQRIADIAASFTNWKNQIDQQKMNFASSIAQYTLANNPSANVSGILSSAMNTANQIYPQSQTVGITQEDIRKRLGQA